MDWLFVVYIAAAAVAGLVIGVILHKAVVTKRLGDADGLARRIVLEARKEAQAQKKEIILQGKDDLFNQKREQENEFRERERELKAREHKLEDVSSRLEEKIEKATGKEQELLLQEKELSRKERQLTENEAFLQSRIDEQEKKLVEIAGMTVDQAKEALFADIEAKTQHEAARMARQIESDARDQANRKAKEIICNAIQRYAGDYVGEQTVTAVSLPSEDMKGRIIGREGRNIRALEAATGVDLIIDDTPEAITLSSFDQTRREVARMALERLIADGRIHPARIEETVDKCRRELEIQMKREGDKAVMELGIHSLHPDLVKLIGRLKYRTSFGQNVLSHSLEVAWLAGLMAGELGVNVQLARRAGLLHDIGKALDHEIEGSHVQIGVDICRKYKENTQIIHAIEAHHGDVEPKTPLAFIIQAADAISAARPGARRENVESYVKRLENLEEISSSFEGVEQAFAVQAGREVRIMVKPDVISDDQVILLARQIAKKIEDTLDYPGQIKVNVIRESRAIEYAK